MELAAQCGWKKMVFENLTSWKQRLVLGAGLSRRSPRAAGADAMATPKRATATSWDDAS